MRIGQYQLRNRLIAAPMAGITDRPYRTLCYEMGAGLTVSEMMSSNPQVWESDKSRLRMVHIDEPGIRTVQIAGSDPKEMADAARINVESGAQIIDINMGCPVPKIAGNNCGSALMKKPPLCGDIVRAVKNAVDLPVTVKIRKGWDENSVNAVEVAKYCEDAGVDAICVHGRTRTQMYEPPADWDIIRQVKEAVHIPVIGNGDVTSAEKAAEMRKITGCDGVMIGRGVQGNPWIFRELAEYDRTGTIPPRPTQEEIRNMMLRHARMQLEFKGEYLGIREMRKHVAWYVKGMKGAAKFRAQINQVESYEELEELLKMLIK